MTHALADPAAWFVRWLDADAPALHESTSPESIRRDQLSAVRAYLRLHPWATAGEVSAGVVLPVNVVLRRLTEAT